MSQNLLINMFYAAPELWYFIGAIFVLLLGFVFWESIHILKLKQKNYFLNRDRERYAETLYAAKDGYFSFIPLAMYFLPYLLIKYIKEIFSSTNTPFIVKLFSSFSAILPLFFLLKKLISCPR